MTKKLTDQLANDKKLFEYEDKSFEEYYDLKDFKDDLPLLDMANLDSSDTGISGYIFISTKMSKRGARIKYYATRPDSSSASFSLSLHTLKIVHNTLPEKIVNQVIKKVVLWAQLNQKSLLQFWDNGSSMTIKEVEALIDSLTKV